MILTHIAGLDLVTLGVDAFLTSDSGPAEFDTKRRQMNHRSAFVGTSVRPGVWDLTIQCPSEAVRDRVWTVLDSERDIELPLVSTIGAVTVDAQASVRRIARHGNNQDLKVTLEATLPIWVSRTPASVNDVLTTMKTITVPVGGNKTTSPLIRIQPVTQRSSSNSLVGWTRCRRFAIENLADEGLYRFPLRLSLGSTTAAVSAGRMLANGNDIRVWFQGREVPRTVLNPNTGATYVWFLLPALAAGKTVHVDVMYGNPNATSPGGLTYPDVPAFDLATSSNATWRYPYTAGKGAWYLSSATAPPLVDQEIPGAWRSLMTLENPDNEDDVGQSRFYLTGGNYYALFDAQRAIGGALALPEEGLADGISAHHPFGITSVSAQIAYRNDMHGAAGSVAVGKFVILTRSSGAMGWEVLYERTVVQNTTPATLARATYTPTGPVKHVAFAVWPWDGISVIETARVAAVIHVRWSDYVDLNVDATKISISEVGSETEVYELATVLSHGDSRLRLGAATTGARAAVELNQVVVVDAEKRTAQVWTSDLSAKVEDLPIYAVQGKQTVTILGETVLRPASRWLPLSPHPDGAGISVSEALMGELDVTVLVRPAWTR